MDQKTRAERFRNQVQNQDQEEQQYEEDLRRSRQERIQRRAERMRRERQRLIKRRMIFGGISILVIALMIVIGKNIFFSNDNNQSQSGIGHNSGDQAATKETTEPVSTEEPYTRKSDVIPTWIDQQLIEKNEFSRPGDPLKKIKDIAIHWVGNAGTTAQNNRNYFANLADPAANPNGTKASSHFVVGLDGEIIQCIPIDEKSYCTNERNIDTISIEVCHPDWEGKFNDATYQSLIKLTAWLVEQFDLTWEDIIRHYDVTGKECPKYYVKNEGAWEQLKLDVKQYIEANPNIQ